MLFQTENPHGGDLYGRPVRLDFSANTNPLGTPPAVRRAVVSAGLRIRWIFSLRCSAGWAVSAAVVAGARLIRASRGRICAMIWI